MFGYERMYASYSKCFAPTPCGKTSLLLEFFKKLKCYVFCSEHIVETGFKPVSTLAIGCASHENSFRPFRANQGIIHFQGAPPPAIHYLPFGHKS